MKHYTRCKAWTGPKFVLLFEEWTPVHDGKQLFANVLCALEAALLDEILEAPGLAKLIGLPCVVHRQQGQVVALRLEKLCPLLVRLCLLLTRTIEDVLSTQHACNQMKKNVSLAQMTPLLGPKGKGVE
jgi:hypothetical protein